MTDKLELQYAQVMTQVRRYRLRRWRRVNAALGVWCGVLLLGLAAVLASPPVEAGRALVGGAFGSVLLREGAGVYVVIAIAAFALGVGVTILCLRRKNRRARTASSEQEAARQASSGEKQNETMDS